MSRRLARTLRALAARGANILRIYYVGATNVQNIFDFRAPCFAGCPTSATRASRRAHHPSSA